MVNDEMSESACSSVPLKRHNRLLIISIISCLYLNLSVYKIFIIYSTSENLRCRKILNFFLILPDTYFMFFFNF